MAAAMSKGDETETDEADAGFVYLSDLFKYRSQKRLDHRVRLVLKLDALEFYDLIWENGANRCQLGRILALNDISGVFIEQSFSPYDQNAYLVINAYPRVCTPAALAAALPSDDCEHRHPFKRAKICIELAFCKYPTSDLNYEYLKTWQTKLSSLMSLACHSAPVNSPGTTAETEAASLPAGPSREELLAAIVKSPGSELGVDVLPKKRFLVFINPHSGSGKAAQIYLKNVAPVFAEAGIYNKLVLTETSGHAFSYVQTAALDDYTGILVVSGDGLIYEVINGLMSRPDWPRAVRTPVGQLPGGSANGLACTISYLTNEHYKDLRVPEFASLMAFHFTKSVPTPMKLTRIQLQGGRVLHSFLNVEWAMPADVDLESERYRFLASQRFLVGTLARVINLRVYKGRLSFLPAVGHEDWKPKSPHLKVRRNVNVSKAKKASSSSSSSTARNRRFEDKEAFEHCVPFEAPVPDDWLVVEDDFLMVLLINLPVMGQDMYLAPEAKFDEDFIWLSFIDGRATRLNLLKTFIEGGSGNFFTHPWMEVVRVRAFRLEPFTAPYRPDKSSDFGPEDGALMVDGERVPYGNIQGECIPSMANVLARDDF